MLVVIKYNSKMGEITNEIVEKSYAVAKDFYHKRITLKKAQDILVKSGMNENSAMDYIYMYVFITSGQIAYA